MEYGFVSNRILQPSLPLSDSWCCFYRVRWPSNIPPCWSLVSSFEKDSSFNVLKFFWLSLFFHFTWVKSFKSVSCQHQEIPLFLCAFLPCVFPFVITMVVGRWTLLHSSVCCFVFWSIITFHYPIWLWNFYNSGFIFTVKCRVRAFCSAFMSQSC